MSFAVYAYRTVTAFGIDPIRFRRAIRGLPHYLANLRRFRAVARQGGNAFPIRKLYPCLSDRFEESGAARGHYFHQDLLVAQRVFANAPERHVDIGSRIDGFVAHVAAFRPIEVLDIRTLTSPDPHILFRQANLMEPLPADMHDYADSISCLHAIEHFGLGRYGDPIVADGHVRGLNNMARLLKIGGTFHFATPIGPQRIEFDAHRVFSVKGLIDLLSPAFEILSFSYVDDSGNLHRSVPLTSVDVANNFGCTYGCGIFELRKISNAELASL